MGVEIEYSPTGGLEILKPTGLFILYAIDCVLLATSAEALQRMMDVFDGITALFGQQVYIKKSKVMAAERYRHAVFQVEKE